MKFSILTIHPRALEGFFQEGLLGKAIAQKKLEINLVNIRDYAEAPHYRVDDIPYGGGAGMVLKCEPIIKAIRDLKKEGEKTRVVVLSAKGKAHTQKKAYELSSEDHLILICGRYEGIDERVADYFADEEISVGEAVLMGGELAAGMIIESVARLVPGVIGNEDSLKDESFSDEFSKEYDQYTRPRSFEDKEVPAVLLGGNHKDIEKWRKEISG
jgi:tRNA (guanine37-N1)-methyltransferase